MCWLLATFITPVPKCLHKYIYKKKINWIRFCENDAAIDLIRDDIKNNEGKI